MRIGVVGAGGVGGYFGGIFARAGHDIVVVARGAHAAAIHKNGLIVESLEGHIQAKVTCVEDPDGLRPVEALLFCVKAYDVNDAAVLAEKLIDSDTAVVTLQNGLNSSERFQAVVNLQSKPLPGMAYVSAKVSEPGIITNTGTMSALVFGSIDGGMSSNGTQLLLASKQAGLRSEIPADIRSAIWTKFVLTASTAGLATVGRVPNAVLFKNAPLRALTISAMEECLNVAAADGVHLPDDIIENSLELADGFPSDMYASMCLDLLASRRLEIDVLSGAVVQLANHHGIEAPIHRFIYSALKPLSDANSFPNSQATDSENGDADLQLSGVERENAR